MLSQRVPVLEPLLCEERTVQRRAHVFPQKVSRDGALDQQFASRER